MRVIGLTGGMAAGKSTLLKRLRQMGYITINSDHVFTQELSKESVRIGLSVHSGALLGGKRGDLWAWLQADTRHWELWEAVIHPHLIGVIVERLKSLQRMRVHSVVLEAPLLFELGLGLLCDAVLTVSLGQRSRELVKYRRRLSPLQQQTLRARQLPESLRDSLSDARLSGHITRQASVRQLCGALHTRAPQLRKK
ncbi:MAG: dephospho-CoA kinase [Holosporales bacterium]|jgi:dephospho-CoA kinase